MMGSMHDVKSRRGLVEAMKSYDSNMQVSLLFQIDQTRNERVKRIKVVKLRNESVKMIFQQQLNEEQVQ